MRQVCRLVAGLVSFLVTAAMVPTLYLQETLPNRFTVNEGQEFEIAYQSEYIHCQKTDKLPWAQNRTELSVYHNQPNQYVSELKLLGLIKIKDVSVRVAEEQEVALCGVPFGIKMTTDGVLVVGTGKIQTENGMVNPAHDAGIREGDILLSVNGCTELSNQRISQMVLQSEGQALNLCYRREQDSKTVSVSVSPQRSLSDGKFHLGLWVRDSSAGIGTLTFCDPVSGTFAGLGHAICDIDTGQILPLSQGEIMHAAITGLSVGLPGQPGELQGIFCGENAWGHIQQNCSSGIYGRFSGDWQDFPLISTAHSQEVEVGPAQILCTLSGMKPQYYDVEIERIHSYEDHSGRNLILHITDPDLLEQSGGILQGMSGSPLVQNGKLIAAVTHVCVNL